MSEERRLRVSILQPDLIVAGRATRLLLLVTSLVESVDSGAERLTIVTCGCASSAHLGGVVGVTSAINCCGQRVES